MTNTTIQARINPQLKEEVEAIFEQIGLKTSDAIRMFLKQTVNEGGLPFKPHARIPNAETKKAIKEVEDGNCHTAESAEELFKELDI